MTNEQYGALVAQAAPKSKSLKNCLLAFLVGGGICVLGQLIRSGWELTGLSEDVCGTLTSVSLIFLASLVTGLSLYDDLARHAGAGTLVPITGFSNAITAPAVEFKTEGFITGLAAKMFTIAGPVLVYGISASVLFGLFYWFKMVLTS